MSIEKEAAQALASGELAPSLIKGISWIWLVIALGVAMLSTVIYKYVVKALADRLILFISNAAYTDKGKLVYINGEKWVIHKLGLFRVDLIKATLEENRGNKEYMKKTLTIPITKYLSSSIIFYEYPNLYSDQDLSDLSNGKLIEITKRIDDLESKYIGAQK